MIVKSVILFVFYLFIFVLGILPQSTQKSNEIMFTPTGIKRKNEQCLIIDVFNKSFTNFD